MSDSRPYRKADSSSHDWERRVIYVVDSSNRPRFRSQLEQMYWGRKSRIDPRTDAVFSDTFETIYLVGVDEYGIVGSALRLNPVSGRYQKARLFSGSNFFGENDSGGNVYELSEYFVASGSVTEDRRGVSSGELFVAMLEFGLAIGVSHLLLLCDAVMLKIARELKWELEPLHPPSQFECGGDVAMLFELSLDAADFIRESQRIHGPVLSYRPAPPPYSANDDCLVRVL